MSSPLKKTVVVTLCLVGLAACNGPGPTTPADPESPDLGTVVYERKGGGGGTARSFDVTLTGDLVANVAGATDPSVKENDPQLNLFDFPMDVTFLQTAVAGGATCFADAMIDVGENIELRVGTPKKGSSTIEANAQYWFDGVSTKGDYTLYRLTLQGSFISGEATWIGDAVIAFTTFSINGQLEGSKGGKNAKDVCSGNGAIATTITLDEVP